MSVAFRLLSLSQRPVAACTRPRAPRHPTALFLETPETPRYGHDNPDSPRVLWVPDLPPTAEAAPVPSSDLDSPSVANGRRRPPLSPGVSSILTLLPSAVPPAPPTVPSDSGADLLRPLHPSSVLHSSHLGDGCPRSSGARRPGGTGGAAAGGAAPGALASLGGRAWCRRVPSGRRQGRPFGALP